MQGKGSKHFYTTREGGDGWAAPAKRLLLAREVWVIAGSGFWWRYSCMKVCSLFVLEEWNDERIQIGQYGNHTSLHSR